MTRPPGSTPGRDGRRVSLPCHRPLEHCRTSSRRDGRRCRSELHSRTTARRSRFRALPAKDCFRVVGLHTLPEVHRTEWRRRAHRSLKEQSPIRDVLRGMLATRRDLWRPQVLWRLQPSPTPFECEPVAPQPLLRSKEPGRPVARWPIRPAPGRVRIPGNSAAASRPQRLYLKSELNADR